MEGHVRSSATKRRLRGIYFVDPEDAELRATFQKKKKSMDEVGSSDASSSALQDQVKRVQGDL